MTIVSLERRLRKIEATRGRGGCAMFAAWGRTAEEAGQALADAKTRSAVQPSDDAMPFVWSRPEPPPRSRWISFVGKREAEIGDRELEIMVETMRAEQARHEREAALAAGEDVSGLDDTDFVIRAIRRESRDVTGCLRQLAHGQNPEPKVHWPQTDQRGTAVGRCTCPTCQTGETSPRHAFRVRDARRKAWLDRYVPGEELFV